MFDVVTLSLLLAAALAVAGFAAFWSHGRRRRRRSRWPGAAHDRPGRGADDDAHAAFPPTRFISYNEAVKSGLLEGNELVATRRNELPRLRLRLRSAGEQIRFATVTVVLIAEEGARRQLYVREEGRLELQRIAARRVEAALDLAGRVRIEDPWAWLAERVPFRSFGQRGEHGDVDTAIHTA